VCFSGFGAYPVGRPLQMMLTSDPSQAQPGPYASQTTMGALKQEPAAPHALLSRNPQIVPLAQSESLAQLVPPSGFGHEPTTQPHAPVELGAHVMDREPLGQAATGGGAPHWQVPASGGGAHTGQSSHPLASVCGITPYLQFGRLQIGAFVSQASVVEPPSGGGAQIGHVAQPFTSVPVPVEPKGQPMQGSAMHASVAHAGKPQPHCPLDSSSQTLAVNVVPSGHTFARAGTATPSHDAGVHVEPVLPSAGAPPSPPEPTKMGPPGAQPLPSAPIRSGKTRTTGRAHATRERS